MTLVQYVTISSKANITVNPQSTFLISCSSHNPHSFPRLPASSVVVSLESLELLARLATVFAALKSSAATFLVLLLLAIKLLISAIRLEAIAKSIAFLLILAARLCLFNLSLAEALHSSLFLLLEFFR